MQIKTKIVSCHGADSKLVKQGINSTVMLHPLVFPALRIPSVTLYSFFPVSDKPKVRSSRGLAEGWRLDSRRDDHLQPSDVLRGLQPANRRGPLQPHSYHHGPHSQKVIF